jgi:hypothetical protein
LKFEHQRQIAPTAPDLIREHAIPPAKVMDKMHGIITPSLP